MVAALDTASRIRFRVRTGLFFSGVMPVSPSQASAMAPFGDALNASAVASSSMVIFGITGDLSRKKLLPAIYDLAASGLLPATFSLFGFGRQDRSRVLHTMYEAMKAGARTAFQERVWRQIIEQFRYVEGTFDDIEAFNVLHRELIQQDTTVGGRGNAAFYMSISPDHFIQVCHQLRTAGLHEHPTGWRRVVLEKPFGRDLHTSRAIGDDVRSIFGESVFLVDHYLGKEIVQNILTLRFTNGLFEPLWNNRHIDHVQITMAEEIGVTGRASYYDGVGAVRDVIQNHLLQLLALVAMEEPNTLSASDLAGEKVKVLSAARVAEPFAHTASRGQYIATVREGEYLPGLHEEEGFDSASTTETYAALTVEIANRRWAGVPFFIRTGKRMAKRNTEIAVAFRPPAHLHDNPVSATRNTLVIRVQPEVGLSLRISAKVPGHGLRVEDVDLDMSYATAFREQSVEAYERLILDVMRGDGSLFPTQAEVEASWAIVDPLIAHWAAHGRPEAYESGSCGPASGDEMMARSRRTWRPL